METTGLVSPNMPLQHNPMAFSLRISGTHSFPPRGLFALRLLPHYNPLLVRRAAQSTPSSRSHCSVFLLCQLTHIFLVCPTRGLPTAAPVTAIQACQGPRIRNTRVLDWHDTHTRGIWGVAEIRSPTEFNDLKSNSTPVLQPCHCRINPSR